MKQITLELDLSEWGDFYRSDFGAKLQQAHKMFPHVVVFEGYNNEIYSRYCWQKFGNRHGVCEEEVSSSPGCPLVILERKKNNGRNVFVGKHEHEGRWTSIWLGHTEYMTQAYFFAIEADLNNFLAFHLIAGDPLTEPQGNSCNIGKQTTFERFLIENYGEYDNEDEQQQIHGMFPYVVVFQGLYLEHDFLSCHCWQKFGNKHGVCNEDVSSHSGCSLAIDWKKNGRNTILEPHSHEGKWTTLWLAKTDYDYGFQEYCFAKEADLNIFLNFAWTADPEGVWPV
ncbi:MAG TPA: hypothetical protein VGP47_11655 [Parachlamydiaceae bacterium]|nr:hypothetical protein [Parachlamydiaceae bacterium]